MKLSILIPTRNGGIYLTECLTSVLAQDGSDFEVIVSDNANHDSTASILAGLQHDERLRVTRLETPVSVTANWNNALRHSSGDYILVIGDDDALLPGYVAWLLNTIRSSGPADCITYNAYTYVAPSSIRGLSLSHFADEHFHFGHGFVSGQELGTVFRRQIIADMFRFRHRIPLNMQMTVFSRELACRVGEVFKPPFPDHYALNAFLIAASRWLYFAHRPLVVGVSPKSFGHFVYSDEQTDGLAYLGINTWFEDRLPGNELLNATYVWLELLRANFPSELAHLRVSRKDYVVRQIWSWYLQWRFGNMRLSEVLTRMRLLSPKDVISVASSMVDPELLSKGIGRMRLGRSARTQSLWPGLKPLPGVQSMREFSEWVAARPPVE